MYLKYNHGGLHCGEVNEVDRDAPSSTDSEDEAVRNGFHEDSDNADNELSDNEDELPYNVEAFINPVFDIDDLNLEDEDDLPSDEEQPTEGHNYYAVNEANSQQSSSLSEMSDVSEENQQEIVEPENEQQQLNNLERVNSTEQNASNDLNNEHTNNVQQGSTSNLEKSGTNDINPNSNNYPIYDTSDYIFVSWEDERIEPIAITTSTYRPSNLPNICNGPYNSGFGPRESPVNMNAFNYRGPTHFGYPSFYPLYNGARGNVGNMHTPRYNIPPIPPLFNTTFSSQHHAAVNPGNTTLHFLPILRHTFHNNPRLPTSHYPFSAAGRYYPRPYSTIFTNTNHRDYAALYSTNYGAPDNSGYTGPRWTNKNYAGAAPTPRNDPTRYNPPRDNARYRTQQASGNDAVNNFASGTAQSTNHNNLPLPGHSSSELPAYFGPHFCGYGNPNSSWYIAPDYSSDVPRYPQFSVNPYFDYASLLYRDTQGVSENAASQSPVSHVNEEATAASASNFYGGAGTSSCNAPACNEPTRNSASYKTQQATGNDSSNNFASGTTQSTNNNDPPLPRHSNSEAPAYFGPHFCGYGNPNSSWYIAPDYSSDVSRYPQFSVNPYFKYVSRLYRDTQGVSENTASQSPVSQVNEEATGASASNSYGGLGTSSYNDPARNEPTQNSASYKTAQASGNDSSDNLASGVMQPTNPGVTSDRIAKASTSIAPTTPGYGSSSLTDQNNQLLPRHVTSVPPFYHRSHSHDYDHPHSSSALSGAADSQYSAPTSSSPDTLDVSENVASQSLLSQVVSRDVASSSTASNNFRASGSIVRSNFEVSGSVMSHNPDFPGIRRYSSSGWLLLYLGYNDPDFNMPSGRHSDEDAELGPSGTQSRRRPRLSSGSQSRSLYTSTGQHGHSF